MDKYIPRVLDKEIKELMQIMGAVLIEGPKWCGESITGGQHAKEIFRNLEKMRAVLRSLARNISISIKDSTLSEDTKNIFEQNISRPTLLDYLNTLERLFVIEKINVTNLNFRSKLAIRTNSKKEFIDSSIATAVLRLSTKDLLKDLKLFGFIFECMAIRDLKVYANDYDGKISFYRNESGFEVDCILRLSNRKWGAIEIKLGEGRIEGKSGRHNKNKRIVKGKGRRNK